MRALRWNEEVGQAVRFVMVGLANTAVGYGIILAGLKSGLGDYAANILGFALGLPISYALHRSITFRAQCPRSLREMGAYLIAFVTAFCANLAVLMAGRAVGYEGSAVIQALAIGSYAGTLFLLTRFVVFKLNTNLH